MLLNNVSITLDLTYSLMGHDRRKRELLHLKYIKSVQLHSGSYQFIVINGGVFQLTLFSSENLISPDVGADDFLGRGTLFVLQSTHVTSMSRSVVNATLIVVLLSGTKVIAFSN